LNIVNATRVLGLLTLIGSIIIVAYPELIIKKPVPEDIFEAI